MTLNQRPAKEMWITLTHSEIRCLRKLNKRMTRRRISLETMVEIALRMACHTPESISTAYNKWINYLADEELLTEDFAFAVSMNMIENAIERLESGY